MASLKERIQEDYKKAAHDKNKPAINALRGLKAAISQKETEGSRHELTDDEVVEIVQSEIKKRKEAIEAYQQGGADEKMQAEQQELEVLQEYMPEQLTEDELKAIIQKAIEDTGAETMQDMGQVMGQVMPQVKGKADGDRVSQLAKELLS